MVAPYNAAMVTRVIAQAVRGRRGAAAKLAKDAGVSAQTVSKWVSGEIVPTPERWPVIESALGLDDGELETAAREGGVPPGSSASDPATLGDVALAGERLRRELDRVDRDVETVAMALERLVEEVERSAAERGEDVALHPYRAALEELALRGHERRANARLLADSGRLRVVREDPTVGSGAALPAIEKTVRKAAKSGRAGGRRGDDAHRPKGAPEEPPSA